jgi:hypothetical protein
MHHSNSYWIQQRRVSSTEMSPFLQSLHLTLGRAWNYSPQSTAKFKRQEAAPLLPKTFTVCRGTIWLYRAGHIRNNSSIQIREVLLQQVISDAFNSANKIWDLKLITWVIKEMWYLQLTDRTSWDIDPERNGRNISSIWKRHMSAPLHSHLHNSLTDFYGTRINVKISLVKCKCLRWGIQYSRPNIMNRQPPRISSGKPKLLNLQRKSIRKTSFNIIWLFTYSLII